MLAGDTSVPGFSAQAKKDLEDQVLDWRTQPLRAAPHRQLPHGRLPENGGDEVSGQPHRLGRLPLPAGQHGEHQRGDAALHPGGGNPRTPPEEDPAPGEAAGGEFQRVGNRVRRVLERAGGGGEPRSPAARQRARRRRPGAAADALLLHPAQRQDAGLLGHRRRPALQDPPLHEHRRRGAPVGAVRAADRSRRAGQSCRRRRGYQQRPRRSERPAAALSLQRLAAKSQRGVQRREGARRRVARCAGKERRRGAGAAAPEPGNPRAGSGESRARDSRSRRRRRISRG